MVEIFNTKYGKVTLMKNETYIIKDFQRGGYWDIDTLLQLEQYIPKNKNILEIGGHCGTSTLVYSSFLNDGNKIFVYEAQKNMHTLLQHNIKQNGLENKITAFHNAVFCENMDIQMNNIDLDGGGGNVQKRYTSELNLQCNFGGIGLGSGGENTRAITIDGDMKHDNIGFIHCDAQGAENFIFAKGVELIKRDRPVILYENNEKYNGKFLYNNVCRSYPQFSQYSKFNLEDYCMNKLNYSKVIYKFNGGDDDLLIP